MKTRNRLLFFMAFVLSSLSGIAQCSNTTTQVSYDTLVTGVGSTNDPYIFSFPKFDGQQGTLLSVNIRSVLTLSYHYDIENTLGSAQNHKLRLSRYDDISSVALPVPVSNALSAPQHPLWYNNNLSASNGVNGSGGDFRSVAPFYVLNNDTIIDEVLYNTADFLGSGTVSFDYATAMDLTRNPVSGALITNDGAADEIKFIVTYTYCSNIMLASDITSFIANKKDEEVNLRWFALNEHTGRQYELLKSTDGKNFTTVTKLHSNPGANNTGNYQFNYVPLPNEEGKLIFRIRQTDADGSIKHTSLRVVDIGANNTTSGIRLLPNPATGNNVSIVFHNTIRADWQVEIFNAGGQLMGSRRYNNSLVAKLNTDYRFSSGLYIIRATNTKTQERFTERLIVK